MYENKNTVMLTFFLPAGIETEVCQWFLVPFR